MFLSTTAGYRNLLAAISERQRAEALRRTRLLRSSLPCVQIVVRYCCCCFRGAAAAAASATTAAVPQLLLSY
eukprot:16616-Heterococcus_DN1.PRE.2